VNVEPALTNLGEGVLNNLFKAAYPTLFTSVELDLSNAGSLDLLELFNTKSLALNGNIEDTVVLKQRVALSTDLNHGSDYLFLDEKRVEAEV